MVEWIQAHEAFLWWLTAASAAVFALFLVAAPWLVARIPEDYFAAEKRPKKQSAVNHSYAVLVLLAVMKNALGGLLVLTGAALLVLPGQGLFTIMLGLALMNFPGKFQLERWLISRGPVLRVVNGLRRKKGQPELSFDNEPP